MSDTPWFNQNWLIATATFLGATATLVGSFILWQQLRSLNRKNEFDILQFAADKMRHRFGTLTPDNQPPSPLETLWRPGISDAHQRSRRFLSANERFYALKDRFRDVVVRLPEATRASRSHKDYLTCLVARIQVVSALPPHEHQVDFSLVREFVNAVNDVGEMVEQGVVEKGVFLARFHLALIREVYLAEPYIYYFNLHGQSGRWGMRVLRLGEMARAYNDINSIHRKPIYYANDLQYGCIYGAPSGRFIWVRRCFWFVRYKLSWYPSMSRQARKKQNKLVEEVRHELESRRHSPW